MKVSLSFCLLFVCLCYGRNALRNDSVYHQDNIETSSRGQFQILSFNLSKVSCGIVILLAYDKDAVIHFQSCLDFMKKLVFSQRFYMYMFLINNKGHVYYICCLSDKWTMSSMENKIEM